MRQNKHVRHVVIRRDSPGNRPGSPEHRTRFSGAPHRFSRESSLPDLRSRRHGCTCPENRSRSTASALYAPTSLSRSSAARANPLILRVFCLPSPMFRHASPSLRRSRYSFTPDTASCMSRPVCVRVRSLAQVEPLTPWKYHGKGDTGLRRCRVPVACGCEHTPASTWRTRKSDARPSPGESPPAWLPTPVRVIAPAD